MQQTIVNLKDLPEAVKQHNAEEIALWIVKYQKFSHKAAIKHAPAGYKNSTLENYLTFGTKYLQTGEVHPQFRYLCKNIEDVKTRCVQPLTPSLSEKKRKYRNDYTKKDNPPPVAKLEIVNKPLTASYKYGIQRGDEIRLCPSEDYAQGYIDCLKKHCNIESDIKIVTVEIGEP